MTERNMTKTPENLSGVGRHGLFAGLSNLGASGYQGELVGCRLKIKQRQRCLRPLIKLYNSMLQEHK